MNKLVGIKDNCMVGVRLNSCIIIQARDQVKTGIRMRSRSYSRCDT